MHRNCPNAPSPCFCTGACMRQVRDSPPAYIRPPVGGRMPCIHPQHNPPGHLYIPPGSSYIHRCPGCGAEYTLHGSAVYC